MCVNKICSYYYVHCHSVSLYLLLVNAVYLVNWKWSLPICSMYHDICQKGLKKTIENLVRLALCLMMMMVTIMSALLQDICRLLWDSKV